MYLHCLNPQETFKKPIQILFPMIETKFFTKMLSDTLKTKLLNLKKKS